MEWVDDSIVNYIYQQSMYGPGFGKLPSVVLPQLSVDFSWVNSLSSQELLTVLYGLDPPGYSMPPMIQNYPQRQELPTKSIKMFYGTDFSLPISDKDRINKDLMFTVVLQDPSFTLKSSSTNVNINSNIYYHGNRKKNQPKIDNCEYKLNGTIVDSNDNEVGVCPSCGKKDKLNLRIRSADIVTDGEYPGSLVVRGSVTCSGDPPNCSKALRIKLWVAEIQTIQSLKGKGGSHIAEKVVFEGETPYFFLLHHRRKHEAEISCKSKKRPCTESSDDEYPVSKMAAKPSSLRNFQEVNQLPNELVNMLCKVPTSEFQSIKNIYTELVDNFVQYKTS